MGTASGAAFIFEPLRHAYMMRSPGWSAPQQGAQDESYSNSGTSGNCSAADSLASFNASMRSVLALTFRHRQPSVFGQIKDVRGFDGFMRRGFDACPQGACRGEWSLICDTHPPAAG